MTNAHRVKIDWFGEGVTPKSNKDIADRRPSKQLSKDRRAVEMWRECMRNRAALVPGK